MYRVLALLVSLSLAQISHSSVVWVTNQEVSRIQTAGEGNFIIHLTNSANNICQGSGKLFYVYLDDGVNKDPIGNGLHTENEVKTIFTLALTALVSGKTIDLHYDDTSSACWVQQITINK